MAGLDEWSVAACRALGLAPAEASGQQQQLVLDLARQVAHRVERPAAPVSTFLLGLAVGRSGADPQQAAAALAALAEEWSPADS